MREQAATFPPAYGGLEALKRAFFRSFFRLLLVFIAIAEWACAAWTLGSLGVQPPPVLHLLVPIAIFSLNRWIVVRRSAVRRPLLDALVRGYVAFAFTSIFCALFLALAGLVWPALALVAWLAPPAGPDLMRVYSGLVTAGVTGVAALLIYGYTLGHRKLAISRLQVPVRGLPPALAGLRIVQISDLHIGQHLGVDELREHVRRVNALAPDLICVTGDLVDRPETCEIGRASCRERV